MLPLVDGNNACKTVDFSGDAAVDYHITQLILCALDRNADELAHARQTDSAVVLLNHTQVVLHELANELDHVVFAVQGALLERLERGHLLGDVVLLERHELKSQKLAHILRQQWLRFELSRVHRFDDVQLVNFGLSVRREKQVEHEVLECAFASFATGINLSLRLVGGLVNGVVDGLIRLAGLHALLLVNEVAHHEAVILNFQILKASLAQATLRDLATQNLRADVVLARKHQLHLVKDKSDLLFVLKRAIRLNLDFLDNLGSLINFTIGLVHLDQVSSSLRVLALEEDFTIGS